MDSNGDYIVMEAYSNQTVLARITPGVGRTAIATIAGESGGLVVATATATSCSWTIGPGP